MSVMRSASSGWRCDGQAFPVHSFWGRCRRAGRDGPRRLGGRWRWPVNDVWLLHLAPSILSEIYRAHGAERKNARDGAACGGAGQSRPKPRGRSTSRTSRSSSHTSSRSTAVFESLMLSGIPSRQARFMVRNKNLQLKEANELVDAFVATISRVEQVWGDHAFQRWDG